MTRNDRRGRRVSAQCGCGWKSAPCSESKAEKLLEEHRARAHSQNGLAKKASDDANSVGRTAAPSEGVTA
jgi:hypothetical protein